MSRRRFILSILISAALPFLSVACGIPRAGPARKGITEGEKAQDFTLKDLKDNSISLSSFFGRKVLLLNFSTTWCPRCVAIIPALKDIHANYKDVEVVAVYIRENKKTLEKFVERHGIPYTILLDIDGSTASEYGIRGVPTVIVVDKDGIIRYKGHQISEDLIKDIVKE